MQKNYKPWNIKIEDFYKITDEKEKLKFLLGFGILAPSGENVQPWKFKITENQIHVINIPERDQSPYNFLQRGSLISHGAVIENLCISSSFYGYHANVELFPDNTNKNLIAILSFSASIAEKQELFPHIASRTTNRKHYKRIALNKEHRKAILDSLSNHDNVKLSITENPKDIESLAFVGSMNERLVLENEVLHDFLFHHINWTAEENEKNKIGFYIKTLELPPPAEMAFKIFSKWSRLKILNKIGISKSVWKQNASTYAAASAIGVITTRDNKDEDFIDIGRATQRLWLTAEKLGLSLQPLTGTLFFMHRIISGDTEPFSKEQIDLIKSSYNDVLKIFSMKNENIVMMFRIGYSDPPTSRALRLEPEIISD